MDKKLHILNGHTTLHLFQEAGIEGQALVWNEILSDGPAIYEVATDAFWKMRKDFVVATFGQGAAGYDQLIKDFETIRNYAEFDEIVLWFEYDWFCQINLMALLSWFYNEKVRRETNVSLICVGKEEGYDRLVALGQLPVRRYPELMESRQNLSEANLRFADSVWKTYSNADPSELAFATVPHPVFSYLAGAVSAYFERFPDSSGLNEIEKELLKTINKEEGVEVDRLVRHMLQWQKHFGFGDLQYYYYIRSMEPLLQIGSRICLNEQGKAALKNLTERNKYPEMDLPMGGSSSSSFRRVNHKLEPVRK